MVSGTDEALSSIPMDITKRLIGKMVRDTLEFFMAELSTLTRVVSKAFFEMA